MNIEPGIFEWLAWYQEGFPNWFTPEELVSKYNINLNYKPVVNRIDLEAHFQENLDEFYNRNSQTMQGILEKLGNICRYITWYNLDNAFLIIFRWKRTCCGTRHHPRHLYPSTHW